MRLSSNLTLHRLLLPGLLAGLLVTSLLPARWAFYSRPLGNAALVLLYPAVWVNGIGSRLRGRPVNVLDGNIETLSNELLKMDGLLRQKDEEIRRLRLENAHLAGLRRAFGESYQYIQTRVIGSGMDPSAPTLIIDTGSRHGLRLGMVVVDGPDLVGRIVQVQHNSAVVHPITAPNSSVKVALDSPAVDDDAQRILLLQSGGQDLFISDKVDANLAVKVGDFARLADDNRFNPWPQVAQFMVVGEVTAVSPDPDNPLWQRVQVRPRKPLYHTSQLTVIAPADAPTEESRP